MWVRAATHQTAGAIDRDGAIGAARARRNRIVRTCGATSGLVSLEALIVLVVTLPIIIGLFLLFPMFMVQQATAHALLQTVESLSLDTYGASLVNEATDASRVDIDQVTDADSLMKGVGSSEFTTWKWDVTNSDTMSASEVSRLSQESFSRLDKWYQRKQVSNGDPVTYDEDPENFVERLSDEVLKPRFALFLGGDYDSTNPSASTADLILRSLYVEDGLDGISFKERDAGGSLKTSVVSSKRYGRILTVTLSYTFSNPFLESYFTDGLPIEQSASVRLWAE